MKVFFDTEFIEDGKTIDLLSIGLVREDGVELYLENSDVSWSKANPWVRENVLPRLNAWQHRRGYIEPHPTEHIDGYTPRAQIAASVRAFAGDAPEFWAYYADYDWVVLCQLYGRMIDLPEGWPKYCRDFKQLRDQKPAFKAPPSPSDEHHALADALWLKQAFEAFDELTYEKVE